MTPVERIDAVIAELTSIKLQLLQQLEHDVIGNGPVEQKEDVPVNLDDFTYARSLQEFKSLNAKLGGKIRKAEDWLAWSDMIKRYGWKNVINATDRVQPIQRWPTNVLQMIYDARRAKGLAIP